MSKNTLQPTVILTIDTNNIYSIPLIVTIPNLDVLHYDNISKLGLTNYKIRQTFMEKVSNLVDTYSIDTIIMEQSKLFIDKIDKFPDPYVLRNVTLSYGLKISIEDKYYSTIKYLIELPEQEWKNKILGKHTRYSIDLYKAHILQRDLDENTLNVINENNYYRTMCLSESVLYNELMNKKYQTNSK